MKKWRALTTKFGSAHSTSGSAAKARANAKTSPASSGGLSISNSNSISGERGEDRLETFREASSAARVRREFAEEDSRTITLGEMPMFSLPAELESTGDTKASGSISRIRFNTAARFRPRLILKVGLRPNGRRSSISASVPRRAAIRLARDAERTDRRRSRTT